MAAVTATVLIGSGHPNDVDVHLLRGVGSRTYSRTFSRWTDQWVADGLLAPASDEMMPEVRSETAR